MKMDAVAIIPARAGSKGLPGKNIRTLAGKPLYRHSVDTALAAGIKRVIVSTDIAEIETHDLPASVEIAQRPPSLAGDEITMMEVLRDLLPSLDLGDVATVLLQPTSPLRTPATVRKAMSLFDPENTSMVMSTTPAERGVLKWGFLEGDRFIPLVKPEYCFGNRQSLPEVVRPNGAVYVFSSARFIAEGDFSAENIKAFEIPADEALDIDSSADFDRCAAILAEGQRT
ncbi:cytidylyltransferase domain-containing protein [Roseibium sp.]|uniref:acylneuraminate cytidylyltransferase family protein n=1 Tax=Roseibium sp. TaxID=1936156 RepID=UPI003A96D00C